MTFKAILCTVCNKQRAQKLCKRCPSRKFCLMCWANTHANMDHGEAKTLCADCFDEPAAFECEACTSKICKKCTAAHMAACECSSSDDEDGHVPASCSVSMGSFYLPHRYTMYSTFRSCVTSLIMVAGNRFADHPAILQAAIAFHSVLHSRLQKCINCSDVRRMIS